jgi:hypothetical protein
MKPGAKFAFVALVLALGTAAGWMYSIRSVNIPENRTLFVVAFLAAVALGLFALFRRPGWFGGVAATVAIAVGSLLPLTMAVSTQELAAGSIEVGDTIPRFTAPDEHGELFDSRALNGHLVLIKFFRAHW